MNISEIPVIIYQMGKVGSTSIVNSLKKSGLEIHHKHSLNPEHCRRLVKDYEEREIKMPVWLRDWESVYEKCILSRQPIKVITPVREPISRNISAFFENFEKFTGDPPDKTKLGIDEIIQIFKDKYPHSVPLSWFEREIEGVLGINIFEHTFPKEKGFSIIKKDNIDLLIMKLELENDVKETVIKEFLQLNDFQLINSNVGSEKDYHEMYTSFKNLIKLDADYISKFYDSEMVNHFYGINELTLFKKMNLVL